MSGGEEFEDVATDVQEQQNDGTPTDVASEPAQDKLQEEPLGPGNQDTAADASGAKPAWRLWMNAAAKSVTESVDALNQNETVQRVVKSTSETIAPVKEAAAPVWERTVAAVTPAWETTKEVSKSAFETTKEATYSAVDKTKTAAAQASEAAAPTLRRASEAAAAGWSDLVVAASSAAEKASSTLNEAVQKRRGSASQASVEAQGSTWQDSAESAEADHSGTPEPEASVSEASTGISRDPASPTFVSEPPATVFTSAVATAAADPAKAEEKEGGDVK